MFYDDKESKKPPPNTECFSNVGGGFDSFITKVRGKKNVLFSYTNKKNSFFPNIFPCVIFFHVIVVFVLYFIRSIRFFSSISRSRVFSNSDLLFCAYSSSASNSLAHVFFHIFFHKFYRFF